MSEVRGSGRPSVAALTRSPDSAADAVEVERAVHRAIAALGWDAEGVGTDRWNPFGDLVDPTGRVFLLVNHVMHRREDESVADFESKVTSSAVISAVAALVGRAVGGASSLTIGNAPLQGCDHDRLLDQVGLRAALGVDGPDVVDLRGVVSTWTRFGAKLAEEMRPREDQVEVDLGADSLLDELYSGGRTPHFRVGDYAAAETEQYHRPGRHVYVVHRRVLESDLIVSVPKLKTHQKVGITCALKGTVGAIALKQCLAHHRLGGPAAGGDEYSPDGSVRRVASVLAERAGGLGTSFVDNAQRVAAKVGYRVARLGPKSFAGGAWIGNDTAWRMTLDIARVLRYARPDGSLADVPQRRHVAIIDGLVAGEGEGPLRPTARREGVLIAGTDPVAADVLAALAMGWEPSALPLLHRAVALQRYPICDVDELGSVSLLVEGQRHDVDDCPPLTDRPFVPPKGWGTAEEQVVVRRRRP